MPPGPAGAGLVLGWPAGPAVVTWPREPDDGDRGPVWRPEPAVSGKLLVADLHTVDPGLLEIADVICCPVRHGRDLPASALRRVLELYPGCAVVAAGSGPQECRVDMRGCPVITVTVQSDRLGSVTRPVLAACFVYGWATAGWPASVLESARLTASLLAVPARLTRIGDCGSWAPCGSFLSYKVCDFPVIRIRQSGSAVLLEASVMGVTQVR